MSSDEGEMGDAHLGLEYREKVVAFWDRKGWDFEGVVRLTMGFTKVKTGHISRHEKVVWFVECASKAECRDAWHHCRLALGRRFIVVPTPWRVCVVGKDMESLEDLAVV
ncbi:Major facilitator superfamily domain, general substrate transporter [Metarhizium brunneum]